VLDVPGMGCPSCIHHIEETLSQVSGVNAVEVRLSEGRVVVHHEDGVEKTIIREAIRAAGYDATPSATS
jgi:copper chaperone